MSDTMPIQLTFHAGTLLIQGIAEHGFSHSAILFDERVAQYRAPAHAYADIVMSLVRQRIPYTDHARDYMVLSEGMKNRKTPRPFQKEAIYDGSKYFFLALENALFLELK